MPSQQIPSDVKGYQELACNLLERIFGQNNTIKEWDVIKNSQDAYPRDLYRPRLDIAIGPFNIDGNADYNKREINNTIQRKRELIERLLESSELHDRDIEMFLRAKNKNPRCLLAIEIEKSGSRKHMLGDIANVSILGSIGIVIPFNDKKLSAFKRIQKYLDFATRVGKTENEMFKNVLILTKENFLRILRSANH